MSPVHESPTDEPVIRIDPKHGQTVRDWASRFGVTPDDVRDAIKAVGGDAEAVQAYLHTHHYGGGK